MAYTPSETVAIVFIAGFAIQQTLQIFDLFIMQFIRWLEKEGTVFGIPTADFKKSLMLLIASGMGIVIAALTGIELLSFVIERDLWLLEIIVSGMVLGSGTEATNIVMKYFGYLKDAQKESLIEVSITPQNPNVPLNQQLQFFAVVRNSENESVDWKVVQSNGGKIDATGLYTADGGVKGAFQVVATSRADSRKIATTTVTVP